eukprot:9099584-Lingulodinium_polyedra.AAC.1
MLNWKQLVEYGKTFMLPESSFAKAAQAFKRKPEEHGLFFNSYSCSTAALLVVILRWCQTLRETNREKANDILQAIINPVFEKTDLLWYLSDSPQNYDAELWPAGKGSIE